MTILVAGGAGYIGSHMVRLLIEKSCDVTIFDNLSTGHRALLHKDAAFIKGDLRNLSDIEKAFRKRKIDSVMHFAASSLVGESVKDPIKYYENNVLACINLIRAMTKNKVNKFIFSSTAAVYGEPKRIPIKEDDALNPANPYGSSKLMIEEILEDTSKAYDFSYIALRYFNAAGAHSSARIGEMHNPETHLIPNILKAVKDNRAEVSIFGDDYPTPDGTCIRDYIHVEDLCDAHLLALKGLSKGIKNRSFNLGSGRGYSVKEVVKTARECIGRPIRTRICARRAGDPARLVASSSQARRVLGWKPKHDLEDIISSAWKFERMNDLYKTYRNTRRS